MKIFVRYLTTVLYFLLFWVDVAQAGPVVAAVGAVTTWLGGIAATTLGSFMLNLVGGTVLTALQAAYQKHQMGKQEQPGIKTESTTAGGSEAQSVIFGRYATSGHLLAPMMVYETDGNPNEWLVYVISLADSPITSLRRIIIDAKYYDFEASPNADGDGLGVSVTDSELHNKVYARFHDGNQTAPDAYLRKVFGDYPERPWLDDMILQGVPYVVLTFKGRAKDEIWKGYPTVRFEVDGSKLYDPRDPAQVESLPNTWKFTTNPAVMAFNVLMGFRMPTGDMWGYGAKGFYLNRIISAMNICDERVSVGPSETRPRYSAGLEFGVDQEPSDVLDELVKAFAGMYADEGGYWTIRAGAFETPEFSITDSDIIVSQSTSFAPFKGLNETVNGLHATYPDPRALWNTKEAMPLYNAAWELIDRRRLVETVSFPAVYVPEQVRALMREMASDGRRQRIHSITLPRSYCGFPVGTIFRWSSLFNRYSNKTFEIAGKNVDPMTLSVEFVVRECDPTDYSPNMVSDAVLPSVPSSETVVPVISGVFGWNAVAVEVRGDRGALPGIRISWNAEIGAAAIAWRIVHVASGEEVNIGTISDLSAGSRIITEGLKPATEYRVFGKLVMNRRTTETAGILVTTLPIFVSMGDLAQDVTDFIEESQQLATDLRAEVDQLLQDTIDLAADLNDEVIRVNGLLAAERAHLSDEVARLEFDILAALGQAQNYTDTAVTSQSVAVQGQLNAMSGRIDEITAALTSDNLITNGNFATDTVPWVLTGATARLEKASQTNAFLLACPEAAFVRLGLNAVGKISQELNSFEPLTADDQLQLRFTAGSTAATRQLTVTIDWIDGAGNALGSPTVVSLTVSPANIWKVYSSKFSGPVGAVGGTLTIDKTQASSAVYITSITASTVNVAIEAKVSALEAARVSDIAALATYKQTVDTRFLDANAALSSETQARTNADSALGTRITAAETSIGQQESRITNTETVLSTHTTALAELDSLLQTGYGRAEKVQDGSFTAGTKYWTGSSGTLTLRDIGSTDPFLADMPAPAAIAYASNGTGSNRYTEYFAVSPSDILDLGVAIYRWDGTNTASGIRIEWYDKDRAAVGTPTLLPAGLTGAGAGWTYLSLSEIQPPSGAVWGRVRIYQPTANRIRGFTNFSLRRRQAFEYLTESRVRVLSQSMADANTAFAAYQVSVNSRFNTVEGLANSTASAVSNTYTRTQADQAIAAAIDTYRAEVNGQLGQKASTSAVDALTQRVGISEGKIDANSTALTSLSASLTTTNDNAVAAGQAAQAALTAAQGKGRVFYQNGAPPTAERLAQNLWIDTTSGNNTPKRWNGTAWVAVTDKVATDAAAAAAALATSKADASVVTALTTRVTAAEGKIESQASSITTINSSLGQKANTTALNALTTRVSTAEGRINTQANAITGVETKVGRTYASGMFRAVVATTPTGASSRVGLTASATEDGSGSVASIFLDAVSGGNSRVVVMADDFYIANNRAAASNIVSPFYISNGIVYIDTAMIRNATIDGAQIKTLTVDTIHVKNRAITSLAGYSGAVGSRDFLFNSTAGTALLVGFGFTAVFSVSGDNDGGVQMAATFNGASLTSARFERGSSGRADGVHYRTAREGSNIIRITSTSTGPNVTIQSRSIQIFVLEAKK